MKNAHSLDVKTPLVGTGKIDTAHILANARRERSLFLAAALKSVLGSLRTHFFHLPHRNCLQG